MATDVVAEWMEMEEVMHRTAVGKLTLADTKKGLSRADVVSNGHILIPVLKHIGTRPCLDQLEVHVQRLFVLARPRGKPELPRVLVAWAWVHVWPW